MYSIKICYRKIKLISLFFIIISLLCDEKYVNFYVKIISVCPSSVSFFRNFRFRELILLSSISLTYCRGQWIEQIHKNSAVWRLDSVPLTRSLSLESELTLIRTFWTVLNTHFQQDHWYDCFPSYLRSHSKYGINHKDDVREKMLDLMISIYNLRKNHL